MFDVKPVDLGLAMLISSSMCQGDEEYQKFKETLVKFTGDNSREYYQEFLNYKADMMKKEMIEKIDQENDKAFKAFVERNRLDISNFNYVNESGYIPIYTFDSSRVNFDFMVPPEGYILQRNTLQDGCFTYQLSQKNESSICSCYTYNALAYFIEKKDWDLDD